ncbi:uncharacterized protein LOC110716762 [Chenopodium quinoa]|uniref:uncharacterized protein LOC110716762 n=1 Tax=Chenopodium quinoa TaxID=63459 RepID=UPI000B78184E|nr:uncharacterized protein LOC110716762 [Chenopodium quinoa]
MEEQILSPSTSIVELEHQERTKRTFSEWISAMEASSKQKSKEQNLGMHRTLVLQVNSVSHNLQSDFDASNMHAIDDDEVKTKCPECVKIDLEDIQDEIDFWNSAIVVYVCGANPPLTVMDGFFRRIWRNLGIDKVALREKGIFMVQFRTMKNRDRVLAGPKIFFDKKPIFMKAWTQDIEISKEEFRIVPTWVQLWGLVVKYWGEKSLKKIAGSLGNLVKMDASTEKREKLQYARVLLEVGIDQHFPDMIEFVNEKDVKVSIYLKYDWKPVVCITCKKMGHVASDCMKGKQRMWVPKKKQEQQGPKINSNVVIGKEKVTPNEDGFQMVTRSAS